MQCVIAGGRGLALVCQYDQTTGRWRHNRDLHSSIISYTLCHKVLFLTGYPTNMDRELKRGTLEMLILRLLHEKDLYGYEIVTTLHERTEGGITMKEGTLYPVLYRMDDAGFVEAYWETQERAVPRKYYRITESGRTQLHALEKQWRVFTRAVANIVPKEKDR